MGTLERLREVAKGPRRGRKCSWCLDERLKAEIEAAVTFLRSDEGRTVTIADVHRALREEYPNCCGYDSLKLHIRNHVS